MLTALRESDGPVAEFGALRAEMLDLNRDQNQLISLQIVATGGVLSIALANSRMVAAALVIPIVAYMLYMRVLADLPAIVGSPATSVMT